MKNEILSSKFAVNPCFCRGSSRRGQSMLESCVVIIILCLLLFGLFQLSRVFVAQEILQFAAGRGARARAIGMNDFMVHKTIRAATIVNAGLMQRPQLLGGGPEHQLFVEQARIPFYLGTTWAYELPYVLAYEDWNTISYRLSETGANPSLIDIRVRQRFPLRAAMHRLIFHTDSFILSGSSYMEAHYPLYLDLQ